jgi:hypothetical protein
MLLDRARAKSRKAAGHVRPFEAFSAGALAGAKSRYGDVFRVRCAAGW